ncbi:MAG: phosphatidylserine/phosphatidylglycerophosphate/cardiolipin synthase family protein [Bacteroidia bacterium]
MNRWFDRHNFHHGNSIKLLQSGNEFFDELYELIKSAQKFIHIQLYIFEHDETGQHCIKLLKEAAGRGVKIFIVVDAYGSQNLHQSVISELEGSGIYFKKFSPFHRSIRLRIGRRLHHKIVLMDGKTALIGGINISRRYHGDLKHQPWLDFAARVDGPVCRDGLKVCESMWRRKMKHFFFREYHHELKIEKNRTGVPVRILQNDWKQRNIEISRFYRQSIKRSKTSLFIVASYFLPGNRMRYLLRKASQRGVKIHLLLSNESDVGLMKFATGFLYPFLIRNNIEIFEWKRSVMHGKLMIVDESLTTIGSYNMNTLSDYGSIELNLLADDVNFSKEVLKKLQALTEEGCEKIIASNYTRHHYWWNQVINWMSYQLVRNALRVLNFFIRR